MCSAAEGSAEDGGVWGRMLAGGWMFIDIARFSVFFSFRKEKTKKLAITLPLHPSLGVRLWVGGENKKVSEGDDKKWWATSKKTAALLVFLLSMNGGEKDDDGCFYSTIEAKSFYFIFPIVSSPGSSLCMMMMCTKSFNKFPLFFLLSRHCWLNLFW